MISCDSGSTDTTEENAPPTEPSSPLPSTGAIDQAITIQFAWSCSDPDSDAVIYNIALGTDSASVSGNYILSGSADTFYSYLTQLDYSTVYYWQIEALDNHGNQTLGQVWNFTTIDFDSTIVVFADTNLKKVVANHIYGRSFYDTIYVTDVDTITEIRVESNYEVYDLGGLEHFESLREFRIQDNNITGLSPLDSLFNLETLYFSYNEITDLSVLSDLTNLIYLDISYNQISDISDLANLVNLTHLNFKNNSVAGIDAVEEMVLLTDLTGSNNQIANIDAVDDLISLVNLRLSANQIADLSPLANLTRLKLLSVDSNLLTNLNGMENLDSLYVVHLQDNQIADISAIENLTGLSCLILEYNDIVDISPLANLTELITLYLQTNEVTNILSLVNNTGLGTGDNVALTGNPLDSISINTYIPQLEARGVDVSF